MWYVQSESGEQHVMGGMAWIMLCYGPGKDQPCTYSAACVDGLACVLNLVLCVACSS